MKTLLKKDIPVAKLLKSSKSLSDFLAKHIDYPDRSRMLLHAVLIRIIVEYYRNSEHPIALELDNEAILFLQLNASFIDFEDIDTQDKVSKKFESIYKSASMISHLHETPHLILSEIPFYQEMVPDIHTPEEMTKLICSLCDFATSIIEPEHDIKISISKNSEIIEAIPKNNFYKNLFYSYYDITTRLRSFIMLSALYDRIYTVRQANRLVKYHYQTEHQNFEKFIEIILKSEKSETEGIILFQNVDDAKYCYEFLMGKLYELEFCPIKKTIIGQSEISHNIGQSYLFLNPRQLRKIQRLMMEYQFSNQHDLFIKTIRFDENCFFHHFVKGVIKKENEEQEGSLRPVQKGTLYAKANGDIIFRSERQPQFQKENKKDFSAKQPTSAITNFTFPPVFGHDKNRKEKQVACIFTKDDVLLSEHIFRYDSGTVSRPWSKQSRDELEKWSKQVKKKYFASFEEFKNQMNQYPDEYNEILARVKFSENSCVAICSDTLPARILAIHMAEVLSKRLNAPVKIIFYLRNELKCFMPYLEAQQLEDKEKVEEILKKETSFGSGIFNNPEYILILHDKLTAKELKDTLILLFNHEYFYHLNFLIFELNYRYDNVLEYFISQEQRLMNFMKEMSPNFLERLCQASNLINLFVETHAESLFDLFIKKGKLGLAKWLVKNTHFNFDVSVAIVNASLHGHEKIIEWLVSDRNAILKDGKTFYTALNVAVSTDNLELAKYLIGDNQTDIQAMNNLDSEPPIFKAVSPQMLDLLLPISRKMEIKEAFKNAVVDKNQIIFKCLLNKNPQYILNFLEMFKAGKIVLNDDVLYEFQIPETVPAILKLNIFTPDMENYINFVTSHHILEIIDTFRNLIDTKEKYPNFYAVGLMILRGSSLSSKIGLAMLESYIEINEKREPDDHKNRFFMFKLGFSASEKVQAAKAFLTAYKTGQEIERKFIKPLLQGDLNMIIKAISLQFSAQHPYSHPTPMK